MLKIVIFILLANVALSQGEAPIFESETGEELLEHLREEYTPRTILSYSESRDTLFSKIDSYNDSLTCVYTGHKVYLDPTLDPTQAAFKNGAFDGINTEHTYPQSKGAGSGNARSDMHHLFPTWNIANSIRGANPFSDIDDEKTDTWLYDGVKLSVIPQTDLDKYSEATFEYFEPREDHKGDVARAIFYFFTIYNEESLAQDPIYFYDQVATLCQWHHDDPVDQKEWERTFKIAEYQDGKVNPFVIDCTLASRTYCELSSCLSTSSDEESYLETTIFPNPATSHLIIEPNENIENIEILNTSGKRMPLPYTSTSQSTSVSLHTLPTGMYFIKVFTEGEVHTSSFSKL